MIRLTLIALILPSSLFLSSCKEPTTSSPHTEKNSSQAQPSKPSSHTQRTSALQPPTRSAVLFSSTDLEARLRTLSPQALLHESTNIRNLLIANPDEAEAILEIYTNLLAESDPAAAITFSYDHTHYLKSSNNKQEQTRKLLQGWQKADNDAFQAYLTSLFHYESNHEHRSRELLALFMSPENDKAFDSSQWLSWIEESSQDKETSPLHAAALDAILQNTDAEDHEAFQNISTAFQNRISDPAMLKHLDVYVSKIAHHYPEQTRDIILQIPLGSYRDQIIERTMSDLGREHPETAAEWLSSPDVISEIFRPQLSEIVESASAHNVTKAQLDDALAAYTDEANIIFDRSLKAYIFSLVHEHPQDALETIDAITDPHRREDLRGKIQAIVATQQPKEE